MSFANVIASSPVKTKAPPPLSPARSFVQTTPGAPPTVNVRHVAPSRVARILAGTAASLERDIVSRHDPRSELLPQLVYVSTAVFPVRSAPVSRPPAYHSPIHASGTPGLARRAARRLASDVNGCATLTQFWRASTPGEGVSSFELPPTVARRPSARPTWSGRPSTAIATSPV